MAETFILAMNYHIDVLFYATTFPKVKESFTKSTQISYYLNQSQSKSDNLGTG